MSLIFLNLRSGARKNSNPSVLNNFDWLHACGNAGQNNVTET